jgi:hypothetical protein
MDYFGLKDLKDLPQPKDSKEPDSQIGEQAPIEETVESPAPTTEVEPSESSE